MHYLVRLAAPNLWRHKRRTLLTFLAICISLLGLVVSRLWRESAGDFLAFTLIFTTALGSLEGYTFTVVGSMKIGIQYLDDGLIFSFLAGVLITLISVYWPARSAARIEPTQALRAGA